MKKKVISLILAVVFMVNCFAFTAFAAPSTDVTVDSALMLMNRMCDFLESQTKEDRIKLFHLVHSYMKTDAGVDFMIGLVDDRSPTSGNALVNGYIDSFGLTDDDKEHLKFFLRFAKCIPTADRSAAYQQLDDRAEFVASPALSAEEEAALNSVYDAFLDANLQNMLSTDHGLIKMVIFNFLVTIGKNITVTDSAIDANDYALYAINPEFASRIVEEFADLDTLNGQEWTTGADFIKIILASLNSSATFTNELNAAAKTVLGRDDIKIYVAPAPDATDITISTDDVLVRPDLAPVTFTAEVYPADANKNLIEWYVNGVKQEATGETFTYTPEVYGSYQVNAVYRTEAGDEVSSSFEVVYQMPALPTPTPTPVPGGSSVSGGTSGGSSTGFLPSTPAPTLRPSKEPIPAPGIAEASSYSDTQEHWAKDYIEAVSKDGIFLGYEDGTFGPDFGVTREEMAVLLVRILDLENEVASGNEKYTDHDLIADYAKNSVYVLSDRDIYLGYGDGSFQPQNILTREEIMSLFARIFGKTEINEIKFRDNADISDWAYGSVQQMVAYGVVKGYPDNTIRPLNDVTRAEAAVMIYNLLYRLGKI